MIELLGLILGHIFQCKSRGISGRRKYTVRHFYWRYSFLSFLTLLWCKRKGRNKKRSNRDGYAPPEKVQLFGPTVLGEDTWSSAAEHYQIRNTSSMLDRITLRYWEALYFVLYFVFVSGRWQKNVLQESDLSHFKVEDLSPEKDIHL